MEFLRPLLLLLLCLVSEARVTTTAISDSATLKRIMESGTVKIGYRSDAKPFSYFENGKVQGYVVDLCKQIVDDLSLELQKPLQTVTVEVNRQNRLSMVASGQIDLECGSTTVTSNRQRDIAFSLNTYVTSTRLLTRKSTQINNGDHRFAGLNGGTIAVTANTPHESQLALFMQGIDYKLLRVNSIAEGVNAVLTGKAQAYVQDDILLQDGLRAIGSAAKEMAISSDYLSVEPYSIGLVRGDTRFLTLVNKSLRKQFSGGYADNRLSYWLRDRGYAVNNLAEQNLRSPATAIAMHD
ncbi:amino acid ABC transporter substrate-binding protein [Chitinimonas sp.]|uniref:amino acid ABC transporter substrate-binding protein n=1 Tax=Chitinimonas sp. TaxID=1934313 RepID=UPI0035B246E2